MSNESRPAPVKKTASTRGAAAKSEATAVAEKKQEILAEEKRESEAPVPVLPSRRVWPD